MKTNEFVLPEKWAIRINKELQKELKYYSAQGFHHSNDQWDKSVMDGFELITFKQYQDYVVKDIPNPEYNPKDVAFNQRKVIGYKLIKPKYKEAVINICGFDSNKVDLIIYEGGYNFTHTSHTWCKIKEAGVMHWFEEVYEKETITLKSGVKLSEDDIAEVKEILNNK